MNLNTILQWGGVIAILLIVIVLAVIRIIRFIKSMQSSDGPQCSCGCDGCALKCDRRKSTPTHTSKTTGNKP